MSEYQVQFIGKHPNVVDCESLEAALELMARMCLRAESVSYLKYGGFAEAKCLGRIRRRESVCQPGEGVSQGEVYASIEFPGVGRLIERAVIGMTEDGRRFVCKEPGDL